MTKPPALDAPQPGETVDLAAAEKKHRKDAQWVGARSGEHHCVECAQKWPCDASRLIARIRVLEAMLRRGLGDDGECFCPLRKGLGLDGRCWKCDARAALDGGKEQGNG